MPIEGYCRICEFWKRYPYRVSERELFNKKVREGTSLRKLELLLEAYGLKAKKDLIRKHISVCMNTEVSEQRRFEKVLQKTKDMGHKAKEFFIRPQPFQPPKCPHTLTETFFSVPHEGLFVKCKMCGKLLSRIPVDPEELEKRQRKDPRNLIIYRSLTRK